MNATKMTKEEKLLILAEDAYQFISWPESQTYMDQEWFEEEAILALGVEDTFGSAAYFIPLKRMIDLDFDRR